MEEPDKKTILAFDTAMEGISVGVIGANGYVVSRQVETQREQSSLLIPLIQEVLNEAQIEFKDLDLIACGSGPGSFTGLRIGLTTARVLALSLNVPLIGLNNLEVMAHHYQEKAPILILLETKRQDFYAQYFDGVKTGFAALGEPFCGNAEDVLSDAPVTDFRLGGNCLNRFQSTVKRDLHLLDQWLQPDPILMAQMALEKFKEGEVKSVVEPLYLRGADVSTSKKAQRKLAQMPS